MANVVVVLGFSVCFGIIAGSTCPNIITREAWRANPSTGNNTLKQPVPYVVIHHTYKPEACKSLKQCSHGMRAMQNFHQHTRKWSDIGYNFCVGGDGNAYEGRGWHQVGTHAPRYNDKSLGICLIGNYVSEEPDAILMEAAEKLIKCGVEQGYIKAEYRLVGHRQVSNTLCPGDKLFEIVEKHPHYYKKL